MGTKRCAVEKPSHRGKGRVNLCSEYNVEHADMHATSRKMLVIDPDY